MTSPFDRLPRLSPAVFGLLLLAILFGVLIVKDLLFSHEAFEDVWQADLTTAVVVTAFYFLFTNRIKRNSAARDAERDQ